MVSKKRISVLIVDDSEDDRDLLLLKLKRGGYQTNHQFVDNKRSYIEALENNDWDLILCDYSMPGFDGLTALNIVRRKRLEIPFILISGAIGEEQAVEAMKSGANDYLMKDKLQRLIPAIERELQEAEARKKHKEAEKERDKLLEVVHNSLNEVYLLEPRTLQFTYLNQAALNNLGYPEKEVFKMTLADINPEKKLEDIQSLLKPLQDGEKEKITIFTKHKRADETLYPIEVVIQFIKQKGAVFFAAIGFDQTDREEDAKRIQEQEKIAETHALNSQFKSEFLANMSHELRTPLNSIILLSKLLSSDQSKNLTEKQLEYVNIIHDSGNSLLELINEVLDLSKIEAGEMSINLERIAPDQTLTTLKNIFLPIAEKKEISFKILKSESIPTKLFTDRLRLEQILRNLLSNAFKFTEKGGVELHVYPPKDSEIDDAGLSSSQHLIAFKVKDTGIGIPKDKQGFIFESFRQVDGSIQRRFGGTGLGLTICKELSLILGGTITLESQENIGSEFTLYLPVDSRSAVNDQVEFSNLEINIQAENDFDTHSENDSNILQQPLGLRKHETEFSESASDKYNIAPHDNYLLVVGQDQQLYEKVTQKVKDQNIQPVFCKSGDHALHILKNKLPLAILSDIILKDMSGWTFVKKLDHSRFNTNVPVTIYSNIDTYTGPDDYNRSITVRNSSRLEEQEFQFESLMPEQQDDSNSTLLLIDDNEMHNAALQDFVAPFVDQCLTADTAEKAYQLLLSKPIDCIILDLTLPDANGQEVLDKIKSQKHSAHIPVIIYSGKSLSSAEKSTLLERAFAVIGKNVGSYQALTEQLQILLSQNNTNSKTTADLSGKTVLVADDDRKSFFSISSVLNSKNITVLSAANGQEAIDTLQSNPQIDAVLMDVMMPVLNGLEAIQKIRKKSEWNNLPIFTVTAKAMKGDRELCIQAGATDYVSKPINVKELSSLLKIWLT